MKQKFYSFALLCIMSVLGALSTNAQVYQSVEPEPGSVVSSLREVTITFVGDLVDFGSQYQNVTVTGDNYSALCNLKYGKADNQIVVTFSEITENGQYTINFPEKALIIDEVSSPAFTLTYTVGEDIEGTATLSPAPGDVKWLFDIVYCNPAIDKNLSSNYGGYATITTPAGETEKLTPVYDWQIGEGKYRLQPRKLLTEKGEYTVNIPGDLFYYNNDNYERVNVPECTFKYTVTGGELTQIVGDPSIECPTNIFNRFKVSFPGYDTIEKGSSSSIYVWMDGKESSVTSISMDYNITVEGNSLCYDNQYAAYTDAGRYYMTFPEGSVLLGEEKVPCTPFVYEFDVVEPEAVKMDFTPADGSTLSMLYHVIVTFPEIESVELSNNPSASILRVREDGSTVTVGGAYGANGFKQINDNTYDIVFSGMPTEDGEYIVVIQKNSLSYAGGYNQEVTLTYNFVAPATVDPTLDPAAGTALDKIQHFTISFPDEQAVIVNPYIQNKTVYLYAGNELIDNGWGGYTNQQVGSTNAFTPVEGSTNAFSFSLSAAALDKGEYTLVIPVGAFLIGEDYRTYSSAAKLNYSCTGEGLDKIVVTPAEPVNALSEMSITYVDQTAIYLQSEWTSFSLYKEVEGQAWGTYLEYMSASNGDVTVEGNKLNLKLQNEYTEDGIYYIEITAWSLFMSDGVTPSTPQRVYWTVDSTVGIENVGVDTKADGRIYTITGIEVKDMSKPGLYICNGKKLIVK